MEDKYMELYETNKEFHDYVDRLTRSGKNDHGKKLEDILARKTVREIGEYYAKIGEDKSDQFGTPISPASPNEFCDYEDKSC